MSHRILTTFANSFSWLVNEFNSQARKGSQPIGIQGALASFRRVLQGSPDSYATRASPPEGRPATNTAKEDSVLNTSKYAVPASHPLFTRARDSFCRSPSCVVGPAYDSTFPVDKGIKHPAPIAPRRAQNVPVIQILAQVTHTGFVQCRTHRPDGSESAVWAGFLRRNLILEHSAPAVKPHLPSAGFHPVSPAHQEAPAPDASNKLPQGTRYKASMPPEFAPPVAAGRL